MLLQLKQHPKGFASQPCIYKLTSKKQEIFNELVTIQPDHNIITAMSYYMYAEA